MYIGVQILIIDFFSLIFLTFEMQDVNFFGIKTIQIMTLYQLAILTKTISYCNINETCIVFSFFKTQDNDVLLMVT